MRATKGNLIRLNNNVLLGTKEGTREIKRGSIMEVSERNSANSGVFTTDNIFVQDNEYTIVSKKPLEYRRLKIMLDVTMKRLQELRLELDIDKQCRENGFDAATKEEIKKVMDLMDEADDMDNMIKRYNIITERKDR